MSSDIIDPIFRARNIHTNEVMDLARVSSRRIYVGEKNVPNGICGLDDQGKVPSSLLPETTPVELPEITINYPIFPDRTIVSSDTATGWRVSATRPSLVFYSGSIIGYDLVEGVVHLETANTNSTTPSDWTIINSYWYKVFNETVPIILTFNLSSAVSAGKYVRVRLVTEGLESVSMEGYERQTEVIL